MGCMFFSVAKQKGKPMRSRIGSRMALQLAVAVLVVGAVAADSHTTSGAPCLDFDKESQTTSRDAVAAGVSCFFQKNYEEAYEWWLEASVKHNSEVAQYNLGLLLSHGLFTLESGDVQNQIEATKWYKRAAEQGLPEAQYNLGIRYHRGIGTKRDEKTALEYISAAADQALPVAQFDLGMRYLRGQGLRKNDFQAYVWLGAAAQAGHSDAKQILESTQWTLDNEDRLIAQDLANIIGK